ncbi:MAG: ABC transporter permease subunit [Blastocatellia bacterium]
MRAPIDVMRFEFRYQLRSPFFLGALLLFALIHFLAITGTGIHLDLSNQVAINGAYGILQVELLLFALGMLPMLAFVTTAITRDFEHGTAALVFATPIAPRQFLLGRFFGALSSALLIGLAGLLGALMGTLMPWLDQTRIAPFSWLPWAYVFFLFILPGTFFLCAIFFAVAALTRSFALTFAAAIAFFVAEVFLNLSAKNDSSAWAAALDPTARLTVLEATRYWTATELNIRLPLELLPQNRLLWLIVSLTALCLTLLRFQLVHETTQNSTKKIAAALRAHFVRRRGGKTQPAVQPITATQSFRPRAQFTAQFKMELSAIFKSPLIYIVLALIAAAMVGEFQGNVSRIGLETPFYPLTSLLLPFLRYGLLQFILMIALWYAADLIHRERAARLDAIVHAAPFPDWVLLLSKTVAVCLVIHAVLLAAVLTLIALQAATGYFHFEFGLYAQGAFLYNGFYFCMLGVLAVVIQTIAPNKWLGLLLTLGAYVVLLSLAPMGYDHPLYSFSIPAVAYSDMNGFGHYSKPAFTLIAYWGTFCVLLLIVGHLFYPRGNGASWRKRRQEAQMRCNANVRRIAALAAVAFIIIGGWIFYNTNIRNEYLSPRAQLQRKADYEKNWRSYENAPAPSYDRIEMALDIFPNERRLESRGSAVLGNHKQAPISEFIVSVNPALRITQLEIESATLTQTDRAQGVWVFRFNAPLQPQAAVKMTWNASRSNAGFVAGEPDNTLVANGTYLDTIDVMPIPGYNENRRITDNAERRQYGLPPAPRAPKLDAPAYADKLGFGIDSRTVFAVTLSTSADQIAVAPGTLQKEWQQDGRRYFQYQAEQPILPNLSFCSARYAVARDRWNDVAVEIYYDPQHSSNIVAMMETAKRGLARYSTEFAPYPFPYLRILEFPNYRSEGKFHSGTLLLSEGVGFVNDLHAAGNLDYGLLHELAHLWWGERIAGAQMQGRWLLTENMADYSALMMFQETSPTLAYRIVRNMLNGYLKGRSNENEAEVPVMLTERHGYLRAKGPHALYALQDIIGKEKVHQALRNFQRDFGFQTSPCPTSKDLVNALRAVTDADHQQLITDLFERIVLYDLQLDAANVKQVDGAYETTLEVTAKQFTADGSGKETEEPLEMWFDVALFAESDKSPAETSPLYLQKYRLHSGKQTLTIRTSQKPTLAALDPFHKMIERNAENNRLKVASFNQAR